MKNNKNTPPSEQFQQKISFMLPYTIKVIWLSNILALSVLDDGFSRNAPCALDLISMFLF